MKKLIILLSLVVLFILPFSCDSCEFEENDEYYFHRTVIEGNSVMIDLQTSPQTWELVEVTKAPSHARMYQLDADYGYDTFMYYHLTDTTFIGMDTTKATFKRKSNNDYFFYRITIDVIADTTGN